MGLPLHRLVQKSVNGVWLLLLVVLFLWITTRGVFWGTVDPQTWEQQQHRRRGEGDTSGEKAQSFLTATDSEVVIERHPTATILDVLQSNARYSGFAKMVLQRGGDAGFKDDLGDPRKSTTLMVPNNNAMTVFWMKKGRYLDDEGIDQLVTYHFVPGHMYELQKPFPPLISSALQVASLGLGGGGRYQKIRVSGPPWYTRETSNNMEEGRGGASSAKDTPQEEAIGNESEENDRMCALVNHDVTCSYEQTTVVASTDLADISSQHHHKSKKKKIDHHHHHHHRKGKLPPGHHGVDVYLNCHAKVLKTISTKNGVVHEISYPLLPPSRIQTLINQHPQYVSIAAQALLSTGVNQVLSNYSSLTFFLPTNTAFERLPKKPLMYLFSTAGRDLLRDIMLYHISTTLVYSDQLVNGQKIALPTLMKLSGPLVLESRRSDEGADEEEEQLAQEQDSIVESTTTETTETTNEVNERHKKNKKKKKRKKKKERKIIKKQKVLMVNNKVLVRMENVLAENGNIMVIEQVLFPPKLDPYDPDFPNI